MRKILLWSLLLAPMFMLAQISINTEPTDASCQGNGSVIITIDGTQDSNKYEIVLARTGGSATSPEDNRDETFTATGNSLTQTFNNLNAGTWAVNVYETAADGTNTGAEASGTFIINDTFVEPQINAYTRNNCSLKDIVVESEPANKFEQFSLLSADGNTVIRAPQTENVFESVTEGNYRVLATDQCGQDYVQDIAVGPANPSEYRIRRPSDPGVTGKTNGFNVIQSCDNNTKTVLHTILIYLNGNFLQKDINDDRFPITITYDYLDDSGTTISSKEITFANFRDYNDNRRLSLVLPNNATSVKATLVDKCGNTHTQTDTISTEQNISKTISKRDCGQTFYRVKLEGISLPFTIRFDKAPAGVVPSDFVLDNTMEADDNAKTLTINEYDSNGEFLFGNSNHALPPGEYTFTYLGGCGYTTSEDISNTFRPELGYYFNPSCEFGKVAVKFYLKNENNTSKVGDITYAEITSGPDNPGITYPFPLTDYIYNGEVEISLLPSNTTNYVITTINSNDPSASGTSCGTNVTRDIKVNDNNAARIELMNTTFTPKCNAFEYKFVVGDIHTSSTAAYLERYNADLDEWSRVGDYISLVKVDEVYTINVEGTEAKVGKYRLAFQYNTYAGNISKCRFFLDEFEYNGGVVNINDYFVSQCTGTNNNTYDLLIDALGPEPLKYRIVSVNGDTSQGTFYQTTPVFTGLAEGSYKIEVKDDCGNTKNAVFEVNKVKQPKIIADLCEGEFGTLKTSGLSRFQTEWYKDGVLVSGDDINDNVLAFNPYTEANDLGAYVAKIIYTGANNCGPLETLPFTATANTATAPNAGNVIDPNNAIGSNGVIDNNNDGFTNLFNYIENYDNYGTWSEVPNANGDVSGLLLGDDWQYEYAASGTYTFKHTLEGTCTGASDVTLVIEYAAPCDRPFNQLDPENFTTIGISNLDKHNVADWPNSVPNGFIVLESNSKGFTITRIADPETSINEPIEGMLVFDTDEGANGCFKLYNGTEWTCIENCNSKNP